MTHTLTITVNHLSDKQAKDVQDQGPWQTVINELTDQSDGTIIVQDGGDVVGSWKVEPASTE